MLPKSLHKLPVMAALILPLFNFSFEGGLLLPQNTTTPYYIIEFFFAIGSRSPEKRSKRSITKAAGRIGGLTCKSQAHSRRTGPADGSSIKKGGGDKTSTPETLKNPPVWADFLWYLGGTLKEG